MENNVNVINAWMNGQSAQGQSLRTDGNALYSGNFLIGYSGGEIYSTKRVIDYTTTGSKRITRAVNLAKSMGVKAVTPIGQ